MYALMCKTSSQGQRRLPFYTAQRPEAVYPIFLFEIVPPAEVKSACCRYVEDEQKARQAANDSWIFSLASGKWEEVKYTSADAPRVCPPSLQ